MTRDEQMRFVVDLAGSIQLDVLQAIADGRIPESWDGHELRQYLADKFAQSTTRMSRPRIREYRNHITITSGL